MIKKYREEALFKRRGWFFNNLLKRKQSLALRLPKNHRKHITDDEEKISSQPKRNEWSTYKGMRIKQMAGISVTIIKTIRQCNKLPCDEKIFINIEFYTRK